ncbi:MAG: hypothetical protein WC899_10745 [bacterium]
MLTPRQIERLQIALATCYAIPFIDDVEDFIFEAIFHFALDLPVPNQIDGEKTKRLFDAVDPATKRGWSLKTLKWAIEPSRELELVIQRADVFDKASALGFPGLHRDSPPATIGAAVLEHWNRKIVEDSRFQDVGEARICILLKSEDRRFFCLYEDLMHVYDRADINWEWTNTTKKGLRGILRRDGFNIFRWYANQKQLFERFVLPPKIDSFTIDRRQVPAERVVALLATELARLGSLPKSTA